MHPYLRSTAGLLIAISTLAMLARHFGWYRGYVHTDTLLHIAAGVMFGLFWLWLLRNYPMRNEFLLLISIVGVATFCAVLWELWEFLGTYFMPRWTEFYMPELGDTLSDISASMLGAVISFIIHIW